MKVRLIFLVAVLFAAVTLSAAQDVPLHRVAFDGIAFSFSENIATGVQIETVEAGTNVSPFMIQAAESPPHTLFTFLDYIPSASEEVDRENLRAPVIRVYESANLPDFELNGRTYAEEAAALADLLERRPDLALEESLPFLPLIPGIQTLNARPRYVENDSVQGIAYLTHRADRAGIVLEGRVFYTFQGFSKDGRYFIAAWLSVDSGVLPVVFNAKADFDQIMENYDLYKEARITALTWQEPDAFYPPLADLDALFDSITVSPIAD
jgi:hypothetical protein